MLAFFMLFKGLFSNALGFIVDHWKEVLIASVLGLMAYQNFSHTRFLFWMNTIPYLVDENAKVKKDLDTQTKNLDICVKGNKTLQDSINTTNAEVDKWKGVSKGLEDDQAKLKTDLENMRKGTNTKVDTIEAQPTPQTCEDSIDFLRKNMGDLSWKK